MKKGQLCHLTKPDLHSQTLIGNDHGYLWVVVELSHLRPGTHAVCKSVATGQFAVFNYPVELTLVEQEQEG
jgi:hypothetical protein